MIETDLYKLLQSLIALPKENEWVEFKKNNFNPEEIGRLISALSNGALLHNQSNGYLVFGIEDETHAILGTDINFKSIKKGNEEIEHWLMQGIEPKIDFKVYDFKYDEKDIVLFEIPAAIGQPTKFMGKGYVRVGSITRELNVFPEKEKKIWRRVDNAAFETELCMSNVTADDVVRLIDCQSYFDLMKLPFPATRNAVLEKFISEKLIRRSGEIYHITNLGGILFAKNLNEFNTLVRKALRVIIYEGKDKIRTIKDQAGIKGYAVGFEGSVDFINDKLPSNEEIGKALRKTVRMYPEIAIRELVANALLHQDFYEKGTGPVVEIFSDRIEITNPGKPIITTMRFIDEYQSRNELLASLMRRLGICEEKGSGIDKVIFHVELFQLPAPEFQEQEKHTKVILYAFQKLNEMQRRDKIRACYQHCCLKYVSNQKMTNQSLRERFKIDAKNSASASRIIADTMKAKLINYDNPAHVSRKYAKYIPFWA
jgi:ATP-dependent DNA helicase RecG